VSNIHYISGKSGANNGVHKRELPAGELELRLLGGLDCRFRNGDELDLASGNTLVLLSYLAHTPDTPHTRERLIDLFWSNRSEKQARNSLRQALSAIRKALGGFADDIMLTDRASVTIASGLIRVDALEFGNLTAQSGKDSLEKAFQMYQGEFMEGLTVKNNNLQQWLSQERSKYTQLFIDSMEELSRLYRTTAQYSTAIGVAKQMVELDPLSETGWRELMQAYVGNGQTNHALLAYKQCREILGDELDVKPEPETTDLHDRIRNEKLGVSEIPPPVQVAGNSGMERATKTSVDAPKGNSILVLPFDNLSQNADQEYLSDGITESLIYNLSLFRKLQVKSRNSSFVFKQKRKNLEEISERLKVNYIVEGSIKYSEKKIRVTVQLFEADNNNQIWGNQYNAELIDLLELEETLCRSIAATITGQVEHNLQETIILSAHRDLQSYELLLSGIYHYYRFSTDSMDRAKEGLSLCLDKDPDNVRAHVFMSYCHSLEWRERWSDNFSESLDKAGIHSSRALELDPGNALVQTQYAELLLLRRDYANALLHADKAIAINPNESECSATKAYILLMMGDLSGALEWVDICKNLDPYHPWVSWVESEVYLHQEQYDAAISSLLDCHPLPVSMQAILAICYANAGQQQKAEAVMEALLKEAGDTMNSKPVTEKEWYQYWYEIEPYQDRSHTDDQFTSLLKAGLRR